MTNPAKWLFFALIMLAGCTRNTPDTYTPTRPYSISFTSGDVVYSAGVKKISFHEEDGEMVADTLWLIDYPPPIPVNKLLLINKEN